MRAGAGAGIFHAALRRLWPIVAVTVAVVAGCGGDGTKTFEDPRGEISVESGEEFRIELSENPSTGYFWRFRVRPDRSVVRYLGSEFELEPGGEDRAGAGGTRKLRFKAVMPGRTMMLLANVFTGGERGRRPVAVRRIEVDVSG